MGNYINHKPTNNSTLAQARLKVKQRLLLEVPAFAIVAMGNDGNMVEEQDFENVPEISEAIKTGTKICFEIRKRVGIPRDDNNSVAGFGDYVNVGSECDSEKRAGSVINYARQVISAQFVGLSSDEITSRLNRIPGVQDAQEDAVIAAWTALEPIVEKK